MYGLNNSVGVTLDRLDIDKTFWKLIENNNGIDKYEFGLKICWNWLAYILLAIEKPYTLLYIVWTRRRTHYASVIPIP